MTSLTLSMLFQANVTQKSVVTVEADTGRRMLKEGAATEGEIVVIPRTAQRRARAGMRVTLDLAVAARVRFDPTTGYSLAP
jgi:hypothetical protein